MPFSPHKRRFGRIENYVKIINGTAAVSVGLCRRRKSVIGKPRRQATAVKHKSEELLNCVFLQIFPSRNMQELIFVAEISAVTGITVTAFFGI